MIIYIGDGKDVVKRIREQHCSGNVEGSALRQHVAEALNYRLNKTKRAPLKDDGKSSTRIRIDLPNPRTGEVCVSNYIRSGEWKYVICKSNDEAKDFQWFAIDYLNPLLNRKRGKWKEENSSRYHDLIIQLEDSPLYNYDQLKTKQSGFGVYILYHQREPIIQIQ